MEKRLENPRSHSRNTEVRSLQSKSQIETPTLQVRSHSNYQLHDGLIINFRVGTRISLYEAG